MFAKMFENFYAGNYTLAGKKATGLLPETHRYQVSVSLS